MANGNGNGVKNDWAGTPVWLKYLVLVLAGATGMGGVQVGFAQDEDSTAIEAIEDRVAINELQINELRTWQRAIGLYLVCWTRAAEEGREATDCSYTLTDVPELRDALNGR